VKLALAAAAAVAALSAIGCDAIPVHMHMESYVQHMDGRVEHKSSDWEGTLDQLPSQLGKAGKELGEVTAAMAKELTEVPPPGKVALGDLHPSLAKYTGRHGADFLIDAKDDAGNAITFQYVRLGVKSYDDFFRTAAEVYAILYETTQVVSQLRQQSAKILDAKVDAGAELKGSVDKALGAQVDAKATSRLRDLSEVASALAVLVPELASKVAELVRTGEALVASAATSLTNPKVVANLGLVKTGLVDSVKVIKESGGLLGGFAASLGGFRS
jgi:hypothetical protein